MPSSEALQQKPLHISVLPCSHCKNCSNTVCSRCYEPYCSWKCQAIDWHRHKFSCKAVSAAAKISDILGKLEKTGKTLSIYKIDLIVVKPTTKNINSLSNDNATPLKKTYSLYDLEVLPLCEGKRCLIVTDASQLKNFLLAVVDLHNSTRLGNNFSKLETYCEKVANKKRNYKPKISELCLAIYEDDGKWYRAYCMDGPKHGKCMLQFIDFGNVALISPENIMPISEELMFPSCTHVCYVNNIQRCEVKKLRKKFDNTPKIKGYVGYNKLCNIYDITLSM